MDGTYKQIVHQVFSSRPVRDYASGWQSWWLEYSTVPVLHLQGWSYCGFNADVDCSEAAKGINHLCGISFRDAPGEGVLYVMGDSEINLTLPLGLEDSYYYWRQKP
jgi:hypothetical protein